MTAGSTGAQEDRTWGRLNAVLAVVVAVCLVLVVVGAYLMGRTYDQRADSVEGESFFAHAWSVIAIDQEERVAVSQRAGEDVGGGVVEPLATAPEEEQERTAAQIEAATKMANAFLNLRYEDLDANVAAVAEQATGPFLKQWTKATTSKRGLIALIRRARATQTGEVVWAGLVYGDPDSADVIVASTGTVANKLTNFEPQARNHRLQLHLENVDGQWLTSDLQFVE